MVTKLLKIRVISEEQKHLLKDGPLENLLGVGGVGAKYKKNIRAREN